MHRPLFYFKNRLNVQKLKINKGHLKYKLYSAKKYLIKELYILKFFTGHHGINYTKV